LPRIADNYIRTHGRYRGWIIGLPYAIARLAKSTTPNLQDETVAESSFSEYAGTILDPNNEKIWEKPSPGNLRLRSDVFIAKKDDLKKTAKAGDLDRIWGILQELQDVRLVKRWVADERAQHKNPTAEEMSKWFSFSREQLKATFRFTKGRSLEQIEAETKNSYHDDVIEISLPEAQKAFDLANNAMTAEEKVITNFLASSTERRENMNIIIEQNHRITDRKVIEKLGQTGQVADYFPGLQSGDHEGEIQTKGIRTGLIRGLSQVDNAALALNPKGGIDLNSRNLRMESTGEKINITFNPAMIAQFRRGDFSGVRIQILDVVPINLMPLLGLKEDEGSGQLAKV